jgi:hypothetical protein
MGRSFKDAELKTLPDPHHNGFWHWGWDGEKLWIKSRIAKKYWTQVKKIKATPDRVGAIMKLTDGKGLKNLKFRNRSQFF